MATLYLTEYKDIGHAMLGSDLSAPKEPATKSQTIAITTALYSAPFGPNTQLVRIHVDAICSIVFSAAGTVPTVPAVTHARLAANQTEYFAVSPGMVLGVITNT